MAGCDETGPQDEGRVFIIAAASVQTLALAEVIGERCGAACGVRCELRLCVSAVSVANHPSVILVDSLYLDPHSTLDQLEQLPSPLGSHVTIGFFNVPKHLGIEARAIALGVRGLFSIDGDLDFFVRGVIGMLKGEVWVPREILARAVISASQSTNGNHYNSRAAELLTRREREILSLIITGASNDEIATKLNISTNTVRTHVYNLYHKIHVPNRMQAVLWCAENL